MKANFKANPIQIVSIESNLANLVDVIFFYTFSEEHQ